MASKKDKHLESAQRFMLKGQLDKAIKDYQQVVALEPQEVRYRQKLAELLVRDSRKEEAIAQYEDIGKHYADSSHYLKAIAVYKQIQRLSPANTDISLKLASLNHKQGLIGNAFAEYGQVVAQFEKNGALKDAIKVLEQMLVIDGEHAATRLKYAEMLRTAGNEEASYQAFSGLLASLRARGDAAAAQQVSERISRLFAGRKEEDLDAVSAKIAAGAYDDAIRLLQDKVKRDRGNLRVWELLCDAHKGKKNMAGVKSAYAEMMNLFPDELGVLEGGIRFHIDSGDLRGALSLIELHLPRFVEKDAPLAAEALLLAVPADLATDRRVTDGLRRLYEAAGLTDKLKALDASPAGNTEAPSAFAPAATEAASDADAPPAFDLSWASAPAASTPEPAAQAGMPWEEEIELDLDDDPDSVVAAAADLDRPLDVPPSVDFGEVSLPETPQPVADEAASYLELDTPFGELDLSDALSFREDPSSSAELTPYGELPSAFGEATSAFGEVSPFGELPSSSDEEAPVADLPDFEDAPPAFGDLPDFEDVPPAFGDLPEFSEEADLEELPPFEEVSSPFSQAASPLSEGDGPFADTAPAFGDSASSVANSGFQFSEDAASIEIELDDLSGGFEAGTECPIELTLADDAEEFPDIEWNDEEEVEGADLGGAALGGADLEVVDLESADLEGADLQGAESSSVEEAELSLSLDEPAMPKTLHDWQEIYRNLEIAGEPIDLGELESHYDLAVGYKEMGMYNQAIKEFDVAVANPQRRLDCLTLQAACYREKGEHATAEDLLRRGRELDVISPRERMALSYELAFLFEIQGALPQAIELYREVHRADPAFHDVAQRLSTLTGEEPLDIIDLDLEEG